MRDFSVPIWLAGTRLGPTTEFQHGFLISRINWMQNGSMITIEAQRDPFRISSDKSQLDIPLIHHWLSTVAYWAQGRSLETVQRTIEHSLCIGVYEGGRQVGFARVVTDYATFAWLCDVFILEEVQGHGLGKWLVETITSEPTMQQVRRFLLATRDAHELYRRYGGFEPLQAPERWMMRMARQVDPVHALPATTGHDLGDAQQHAGS